MNVFRYSEIKKSFEYTKKRYLLFNEDTVEYNKKTKFKYLIHLMKNIK